MPIRVYVPGCPELTCAEVTCRLCGGPTWAAPFQWHGCLHCCYACQAMTRHRWDGDVVVIPYGEAPHDNYP